MMPEVDLLGNEVGDAPGLDNMNASPQKCRDCQEDGVD